jgi:short-subunit dehydrogenase
LLIFSASKSAVNAYSDILRHEMRQFGVKVIILEPSFYKTPLMDLKPLNDKIDKMYAECHPDEKQFYGKEYVDFCK